jgi:hypothetical protein
MINYMRRSNQGGSALKKYIDEALSSSKATARRDERSCVDLPRKSQESPIKGYGHHQNNSVVDMLFERAVKRK